MGFYDAFFGSEQSQYTAYAIVAAIIAICITILLTATDVPVSNRLLIVFFVIISLVPSVFLTLFELTCIVTGGTEPNHWWCNVFAWILAAFIIIYCIFIVIISLISLFTYNNAIDNVKVEEQKDRLTPEVSNNYAKQIINNDEENTKQIEKFYAEMEMKMQMDNTPPNHPLNNPFGYLMNQADPGHPNTGGSEEKLQQLQQSQHDQISTFINQQDTAHFYGGSIPAATENDKEKQVASQPPALTPTPTPPTPTPSPPTKSSSSNEPIPLSTKPNANFTDINGEQELFNDGFYSYGNLQ